MSEQWGSRTALPSHGGEGCQALLNLATAGGRRNRKPSKAGVTSSGEE